MGSMLPYIAAPLGSLVICWLFHHLSLVEIHSEVEKGQAMMDILRNHPGGICMHGGFETTSAMVSELREGKATHWLTGDALGMLG